MNKNVDYDDFKNSFDSNCLVTSRIGCVESSFILKYKYNQRVKNSHFDYTTKENDFYMKKNAGLYYKNKNNKKKVLDWWIKNACEFIEKSTLTSCFSVLNYDLALWKALNLKDKNFYNWGELHKFILKNSCGKKLLYVGNGVKSIEHSFSNNIFKKGWNFAINDFSLECLECPQTTLGMPYPDESIIETTEILFKKICDLDFDTAIFGCGAYGPPLINYLNNHFKQNKNLIYLGSSCFSMFCIYSEGMPINYNDTDVISENWIKVLEKCPEQCKNIDAGKYWSTI